MPIRQSTLTFRLSLTYTLTLKGLRVNECILADNDKVRHAEHDDDAADDGDADDAKAELLMSLLLLVMPCLVGWSFFALLCVEQKDPGELQIKTSQQLRQQTAKHFWYYFNFSFCSFVK